MAQGLNLMKQILKKIIIFILVVALVAILYTLFFKKGEDKPTTALQTVSVAPDTEEDTGLSRQEEAQNQDEIENIRQFCLYLVKSSIPNGIDWIEFLPQINLKI